MRDCRFKVSKFSFLILKKGNVGAIMILNLNKRLFKYMNENKALGAQFANVFMCSILWNQNFSWSDELKLWKFHENFSRRGMPNNCFQSSIKPFYNWKSEKMMIPIDLLDQKPSGSEIGPISARYFWKNCVFDVSSYHLKWSWPEDVDITICSS